MGRHIRNGVPYGGTVNDSRMVKHKDTTVFEAIEDTNSNLSELEGKVLKKITVTATTDAEGRIGRSVANLNGIRPVFAVVSLDYFVFIRYATAEFIWFNCFTDTLTKPKNVEITIDIYGY